jgi:uncharacterized protein YjiS (DUF1127 family)
MSVLSIRSCQRQRATASTIYGLLETIERWWVAYLTWQLQRAAIAHLALLSDRELKNIELHRSQPQPLCRTTRIRFACPTTTTEELQH